MSGANASPIGRSNQGMPEPVIFKDLPATFPENDNYKKPSFVGSVLFHAMLILTIIVVPLLMPQAIPERELLIALVSPIGPPPAPPPPRVEIPAVVVPKAATQPSRAIASDALMAPVAIPREIAKIVDEPVPPPSGVIGGVIGGVPGGVSGGVLGGILAANSIANAPAPLPPPPPPKAAAVPVEPVRVGGVVKEPRPVKVVPPVYPPLASRARVSGTVVLEATLTALGTVDQIRVVSGHPLLVEAAIVCVKQWIYEPTYLNGEPVPVILTAKVHFLKAPIS